MAAQDDKWAQYYEQHIKLKLCFPSSKFQRCFNFRPDVWSAVKTRNSRSLPQVRHLDQCTSVDEFCDSIDTLLDYEELHRAVSLREFDQTNQKLNLKYSGEKKSYGVEVPLLGASPQFDQVILQKGSWLEIARTRVEDDYATLMKQFEPYDCDRLRGEVNLSFIWSGIPYKTLHQAIAELRESWTMRTIVTDHSLHFRSQSDKVDLGELTGKLNKLDSCQRQAVNAILRAKCRPRAYIVIGPPGSGKSHVIVESVVQIHQRTQMKMLVCVSSNCCADSLYDKLTEALPEADDIYRLKAGDKQDFRISSHRLVIATNSKSDSLRSKHVKFDYVFMDEANHAGLTDSLVPMSLLRDDGCFVLCGDSKQLNPREYLKEASKFGLNSPLLDKLLKFKQYQVDNDNSSDYITRLVQSYRCDERILATSNELFYNHEVKCLNKTPGSILNIMRLTGPVQFVPVNLDSSQEAAVPYCNEKEALYVVDLVIKLYKVGFDPKQIGVVSPYKRQARLISTKLASAIRAVLPVLEDRYSLQSSNRETSGSHNDAQGPASTRFRDWSCKIDSVADYQGEEREVIIISTAEHSTDLGSLEHEGRFNVAISRAKWLMLIVGNPNTLRSGNLWPKLLDHAIQGELEEWRVNFERQSSRAEAALTQSLRGLSLIDL